MPAPTLVHFHAPARPGKTRRPDATPWIVLLLSLVVAAAFVA